MLVLIQGWARKLAPLLLAGALRQRYEGRAWGKRGRRRNRLGRVIVRFGLLLWARRIPEGSKEVRGHIQRETWSRIAVMRRGGAVKVVAGILKHVNNDCLGGESIPKHQIRSLSSGLRTTSQSRFRSAPAAQTSIPPSLYVSIRRAKFERSHAFGVSLF
jgi:hypothetical protein